MKITPEYIAIKRNQIRNIQLDLTSIIIEIENSDAIFKPVINKIIKSIKKSKRN